MAADEDYISKIRALIPYGLKLTPNVQAPELDGWKSVSLLRIIFSRESRALDPPGKPESVLDSVLMGPSTDME